MEKLKTIRNVHRTTITRLINKTNEKISKNQIGNQELSAVVETLMKKRHLLENLDKQILDGTEVGDVEQEMLDSDKYNSHLEAVIHKFKDIKSRSGAKVTTSTFSKEEINATKLMIVMNILTEVLYDLIKQDKPNVRPLSDCDIVYLYAENRKLNKHIPSNGWGGQWQKLQTADIAIGDDIERIRLTRNEVQHFQKYEIEDTRFNELCNIIRDLLKRFNHHNKPARLYTDHLDDILAKTFPAVEVEVFEKNYQRDIRLVVVGKKGAGKTSLVKRLFSETITDVTSTNGIEIHTINCKTVSDDVIWNKFDGNNEESKIYAGLLKQYKETSKASLEATNTAVEDSMLTTILYSRTDESKESETSSQQPEIRKPAESQVKHLESSHQQNRIFEQANNDLENMFKSDVNLYDTDEYATLLLWDFGGDEEFYHTHQTFLSQDAIYLVVTKLSEANDKEAQDLFRLWMDSIHCYCKMERQINISDENIRMQDYLDPPVVIVGTWKDAVTSQSGESKEACKKSLLTYTENITEDERRHVRDDVYISNTEDDSSVFQSIRQDILKLARTLRTWNKDYPLKFIQLEKSLHDRKKVKPIVAFDELKQISTETPKPLNDEELILYLKYHHDIRALVYFEDLPDYIILDTQWLSDAFKCIVTAKKFCNVNIKNQKNGRNFTAEGNYTGKS